MKYMTIIKNHVKFIFKIIKNTLQYFKNTLRLLNFIKFRLGDL